MRTLSAAAAAAIANNTGNEIVIAIEIKWRSTAKTFFYAEKEITSTALGTTQGLITTSGALDNSITITGVTSGYTGDGQTATIRLSDVTNVIKTNIIQSHDIHKAPCDIYAYIIGTDYDTDKIFLYKGEVNTPISWKETDRTLEFKIVNKIENNKVGFSIDEAVDFARQDLIGQPWPLAFGTNNGVPALRVNPVAKGILKKGLGVRDFTIPCRIDQLGRLSCPLKDNGLRCGAEGSSNARCNTWWIRDPTCECRISEEKLGLEASFAAQIAAEEAVITVIGGEAFPQNEIITLTVCQDAEITGIMVGDQFTIHSRKHPMRDELTCPPTKNFSNPGQEYIDSLTGGLGPSSLDPNTVAPVVPGTLCTEEQKLFDRNDFGWDYYSNFPVAEFYWCDAGSEVLFTTEVVYIANLIPSTIHSIYAWRTFENGTRQFVEVPSSLYTTRVSDFNVYNVQEIVFDKPLSRRGEGWEDEIYVNMTSTVGPNPVDIMEWLIALYLPNLTWNTANFDALNTKLDIYPAHFSLHEDRPSCIEVLRKIAFEARCALLLRNDEFRLVYLPDVPAADFTLDESVVLPDSFEITHSPTEELVTKINGSYFEDYSNDPLKFTAQYNLGRYGVHEDDMKFTTLTQFKTVVKTLTFWLIRMSNTWQKIKVRVPAKLIDVEVLDACNLTLANFVPGTIRCVVEKAVFDRDANEIELELWTPVRSGEKTAFDFAHPAAIPVTKLWPTIDDIEKQIVDGDSPNVDVEVPSLHPIEIPSGWNFGGISDRPPKCGPHISLECGDRKESHGDTFPTDLDDTKPEKEQKGGGDIPDDRNPLGRPNSNAVQAAQCCNEAKSDAAKANDEANKAKEGQSDTGGGEDGLTCNEQREALPDEPPDECHAVVRICWTQPVNGVEVCGMGGSNKTPGVSGRNLGTGGESDNCEFLYFNSLQAAEQAGTRWATIASSYSATNGEPWPIQGLTGNFTSTFGDWFINDCAEPSAQQQVAHSVSGGIDEGGGSCSQDFAGMGSVSGCSGGSTTTIPL